jgi:hypothetical protein
MVLGQHGEEEVVLAGEVRVDRALRVTRFLRDLVESRGMQAARQEDSACRPDELAASPILPLDPAQP